MDVAVDLDLVCGLRSASLFLSLKTRGGSKRVEDIIGLTYCDASLRQAFLSWRERHGGASDHASDMMSASS